MATNPLLAEINNLSPGAKAALASAHQAASQATAPPPLVPNSAAPKLGPAVGPKAPVPDTGPPPTPAGLAPPNSGPMPAAIATPGPSEAPPSVMAPPGTIPADTAELARKESTGSGISQIHGMIENSRLGQAHPLLGKILGWGAQVPAMLGDIAGSAVAPEITRNLPGTEYHHDVLVKQGQRQVAGDVANAQKEAETGETQARTQALENPPDPNLDIKDTDQGIVTVNPRTGAANPLMVNGQAAQSPDKQFNQTPEQQTFAGLLKKGMDPLEAYGHIEQAKNIKDPSLQQQYLDALNSGDTAKTAAIEKTIRATKTEPSIQIKETPTPGAANKTRDANTEKEYTAARKDLSTSFSKAQTQLDSINEASSLIDSGAIGQALGTVKTLVGIAGGQGSGVRITQAELNSIAKSQGIQGDFQSWISKMEGQGQFSPQQKQQLHAVLGQAQQKLQEKSQMLNDTLDKLDGAGSTDEIRKIQSDYRHQSMGTGETPQSSGKAVSLKAAMGLPVNKGKSEADVRKDIESHGHQVGP